MAYHPSVAWNAANASKPGVIETTMISRSLAALAVFFVAAAYAGSSDDIITAIGKCASVKDGAARLACYDQIAAQARAVTAVPQQTVAVPPAAPQQPVTVGPVVPPVQTAAQTPPATQKDESWFGLGSLLSSDDRRSPSGQMTPAQFGSEALAPPPAAPGQAAPEPLDSITATVDDFALNPFGRFTVFLDNGQIWKQLEGDTGKAYFSKNSKNRVAISRGMIGSYNLVINDHGNLFKVKRIK